jgi:hypothetical protein
MLLLYSNQIKNHCKTSILRAIEMLFAIFSAVPKHRFYLMKIDVFRGGWESSECGLK